MSERSPSPAPPRTDSPGLTEEASAVLPPPRSTADPELAEDELARAVLDMPPYAVIVVDAEDRIVYWSAGARRVFGYASEEASGRVLHRLLIPSDENPSPFREEPSSDSSRGSLPGDRNVRCRDGRWIRVNFSRRPLARGSAPGREVVVMKDISERVRALRFEAEAERMLALRLLAGELSHEIRNPLGTIAINVDLLREELANSDLSRGERANEIADILRLIDEEVRSLQVVADEYLELARHPIQERSSVQLRDFLGALLRFLTPELRQAKVEVVTEFATELPPVSVFSSKLKQAFTNLVRNAIEAMPEGGRLTIRVRGGRDRIRIEIADTGVGVSEETARRLFTPFHSTKESGTGLGLVIARESVAALRGALEFRSEQGRGTTVTILLPHG